MVIELSNVELDIVLDALAHHPDPEHYDFGPAYEIDKRDAEALYERLKKIPRPR